MTATPLSSDPVIPPDKDSVLYMCVVPWMSSAYTVWMPKSEIPTFVDPARMAAQLVATMNFEPLVLGSTPEAKAGSVGLIGLPTWLWAKNPSGTTWGPNTKSVSLNGVTVTATGTAKKILWTMGNGHTVACDGPGTPYEGSFGTDPSPTCNYRYPQPGEYDITATVSWSVAWSASTGESGVIPFQIASRGHLVIGEAQVINR